MVPDGVELGGKTSGSDALKRHSYRLFAAYDNRANFPLYEVTYQYDGLYPSIVLTQLQENRYIGFSLKESNRFRTTDLLMMYPLGTYQFYFGGTLQSARFQGVRSQDGGLRFRLTKDKMWGFPDSIAPDLTEKGVRADVTVSGFFTGGGKEYLQVEERFEYRLPTFNRHFLRFSGEFGKSYNPSFPPVPFVGGGQTVLTAHRPYLLRGYDAGVLYGRKIMTFHLEYWLPIRDFFWGYGSLPATIQRLRALFFTDLGTAEYVAGSFSDSQHWPVGVGLNILWDMKFLAHFPWTVGVGFHQGLTEKRMGETQFVFGLYSNGG